MIEKTFGVRDSDGQDIDFLDDLIQSISHLHLLYFVDLDV